MKKGLIIGGLVVFLLGILFFTIAYNINYSDGYRSGTVVKLSSKGNIFKTYEGQLFSGGMATSNGGDMVSNMWDFSVEKDNKQVLEDIEAAVDAEERVKLRYKEKYFTFFWRGDTKYFIYAVEKVGAAKPKTEETEETEE